MYNPKTHEIENLYINQNDLVIQTSDAVGGMPPTYRKATAADRMNAVISKVSRENENKKEKEPLNWKLLIGLKQPI